MNIEELRDKVKGFIDQIKIGSTPYLQSDKKPMSFNPIYAKAVSLKNRIEIHTELDNKPLEMMEKRAPYEDDRQYKYRKENWNNVTMPYFEKAIGVLNRIWNPSNYSVNWKQTQLEEKEYFETGIPLFRSIESYFEQIPTVIKITDPNAILVVKPYFLPTKEVETDEGRVQLYDNSQYIPAIPVVVGCEDVMDYMEGVYAIILLKEKSLIKEGTKMVRDGLIFEIYDTENIYRIVQVGKKSDWKFTDPEIYYNHALGYLPCQKLKGTPKQKGVHVYYESVFIKAIPNLDQALYYNSNLDLSIVNHLSPQRSEIVDKCDEVGCNNGYLHYEIDGVPATKPCHKCKGAGTISNIGPMMVKQITMPTSNDPTPAIPTPGIYYTSPPYEPLEFVDKKIESLIIGAFSFVNIDVSNSKVKGSDVALSKTIDREELFAFILKFSNEVFDLFDWSIETIGKMRFGKKFEQPEVAAPTTFEIRTEGDLTEEVTESSKNAVPEIYKKEVLKQLINKRFSSQLLVEKSAQLIFAVDRLITCSNLEIAGMIARGSAHVWEDILHSSASSFLEEFLINDPNFFKLEYEEQKKALVDKAKEVEQSIKSEKSSTKSIVDMANVNDN